MNNVYNDVLELQAKLTNFNLDLKVYNPKLYRKLYLNLQSEQIELQTI